MEQYEKLIIYSNRGMNEILKFDESKKFTKTRRNMFYQLDLPGLRSKFSSALGIFNHVFFSLLTKGYMTRYRQGDWLI